jgi:hypothetical protein
MDVWLLEPLPAGSTRPPAAELRVLGPDDNWADAPELGYLGPIFDQDTSNLERIQRGLASTSKPGITLGRYQESRIRHFHSTLGRYVDS